MLWMFLKRSDDCQAACRFGAKERLALPFNLKAGNQFLQLTSLVEEGIGRCRRLLGHGGILLGRLVHMVDGHVHLLQAHSLFLPEEIAMDSTCLLICAMYSPNGLQSLTGFAHELHAAINLIAGILNEDLDFLGRLGRPLSQLTHFLGNDGKTLARLSRPRCFNASIQGQEIGLERDFIDNADDIGNLA